MIMEPLMMNAGIVPPQPGYLEGVRELTRRHGVLLAFDEVKTGLTVGPGGATALLGVQPDIVCLAKAMGGGVPCGAIGGTDEVMEAIADGTLRAGRDVQRQPAHDGGGPRHPHRGAGPVGLRALRGARPAHARRRA